MKKLQLFIAPQSSENKYLEVDMYDDEGVTVVDSIQDVKDITKIYNMFSRGFSVPASDRNNLIFANYYNNFILSHDARFKTPAIIKINGADYRKGFISTNGVKLSSNDKPEFYRLTFSEVGVTLKDVLDDDKLEDLDFTSFYQHENSISSVVQGIRDGLYKEGLSVEVDGDGNELYPDIIYAPIFTGGKAVPVPYNTSATMPTDNSYDFYLAFYNLENKQGSDGIGVYDENTDKYLPVPVKYSDYKPAIKIGALLELIRSTYPTLNFTDELIHKEELDQMYLWMNRKISVGSQAAAAASFSIGADIGLDSSTIVNYSNNAQDAYNYNRLQYAQLVRNIGGDMPSYTVVDTNYDGLALTYSVIDILLDKRQYTGKIDIQVEAILVKSGAQTGQFHSLWKETKKDVGTSGTDVEVVTFNTTERNNVYNLYEWERRNVGDEIAYTVRIISSSQLAGDVDMTITSKYPNATLSCIDDVCLPQSYETYISTKLAVFATGYRDYSQLIPDMSVIDLLTGIFKLLNLTTYVDVDGNVIVVPLDEYYEGGNKLDVTRSVDMTDYDVSKALFYKDLSLKYLKSDDILSKNARSRSGDINFPDALVQLKDNIESGSIDANLSEGKNFKLQVPFSCIMYERLYTSLGNESTPTTDNKFKFPNTITDMQVGHSLNDKIDEQDIKNLLFFGKKVDTNRSFIEASPTINSVIDMAGYLNTSTSIYEHGNTAGMYGNKVSGRDFILVEDPTVGTTTAGLAYAMTPLKDAEGDSIGADNKNHYWIPSNIMASRFRRNGFFMNKDAKYQGLQFGNKNDDEYEYYVYDEYDSTDPTDVLKNNLRTDIWINGMYETFYSIYLEELYSERARIYKVKANLPSEFLTTYSLKDTLVVGNREFTINKANINIVTGESQLELLTDIPDANNGALINNGALEFVSYDTTSVTFKLTSIQLWNGEFPDTVKIYSGDFNNNVVYTITGLDSSDYTDIGGGLYSLDTIFTSAWLNSTTVANTQTAYATLISANGAVSNNSNTVEFINLADAPIPLASISLLSESPTTLTFTLGGTDYSGAGIQTAELRYNSGTGPLITQFAYDGSPLNWVLGGLTSTGTSYTVALQVTDGAGKKSLWVTATGTTTGDTVRPEKPVLSGYLSGVVNLSVSNLVDNVGVVKWYVYRSKNSPSSFGLYSTQTLTAPATTGTYVDNGVSGGNTYYYSIVSEDAAGNLSSGSNILIFTVIPT